MRILRKKLNGRQGAKKRSWIVDKVNDDGSLDVFRYQRDGVTTYRFQRGENYYQMETVMLTEREAAQIDQSLETLHRIFNGCSLGGNVFPLNDLWKHLRKK